MNGGRGKGKKEGKDGFDGDGGKEGRCELVEVGGLTRPLLREVTSLQTCEKMSTFFLL